MKVTIDRATWSAGERVAPSRDDEDVPENALLTHHGTRCCLGFLGQSCGVPDTKTLNASLPSDVEGHRWPSALFDDAPSRRQYYSKPDDWEIVFSLLNDFEDIDDATRESWIATGFRIVLGVEVEFVGEYPEAA